MNNKDKIVRALMLENEVLKKHNRDLERELIEQAAERGEIPPITSELIVSGLQGGARALLKGEAMAKREAHQTIDRLVEITEQLTTVTLAGERVTNRLSFIAGLMAERATPPLQSLAGQDEKLTSEHTAYVREYKRLVALDPEGWGNPADNEVLVLMGRAIGQYAGAVQDILNTQAIKDDDDRRAAQRATMDNLRRVIDTYDGASEYGSLALIKGALGRPPDPVITHIRDLAEQFAPVYGHKTKLLYKLRAHLRQQGTTELDREALKNLESWDGEHLAKTLRRGAKGGT